MLRLDLIVLSSLLLLFLVALLISCRGYKRAMERETDNHWTDDNASFAWGLASLFSALMVGALIIVNAISFAPYNPKYWMHTYHTGTITDIDATVKASGKYVTNMFAVTLAGDDEIYRVTDARISHYNEGDDVTLSCTVGWVYAASDVYNCVLKEG